MIQLKGKPNDIGGGLKVTRVLPQAAKRMVGPFTFFDHMGPVTASPTQNIDVLAHPHIGLSTLTYLLEGRMVHRDSLGSDVTIVPGDVNWMTAGKGISHSERTHHDDRAREHRLEGFQLWIALPDALEDCDPSFDHYDRSEIPVRELPEYTLSVIAGEAFGMKSSVRTSSPLLLAYAKTKKPGALEMGFKDFEIGIYAVSGPISVNGQRLAMHEIQIFPPGSEIKVDFQEGAGFVILGGESFTTPRHIWWNLVSSSREKIEIAKKQWKDRTFPMVPGETEFIPAPDR